MNVEAQNKGNSKLTDAQVTFWNFYVDKMSAIAADSANAYVERIKSDPEFAVF